MYADDIALYQIIQSPEDYLLVQHDINAVSEWITANYLALNYRKCCHLLFSRKRSPTLPVAPLEVNGNFVKQVNEYKYLGVILTSDMSWSSHISAISSKTRKLIGVLYRKFYLYSEPHTLLRLYQSLIRPHLEYACSVWDPHLKKDIERLEGVQKFGLKVCLKRWRCGYEELLQLANLPTLVTRRKCLKLCLFYNMVNRLATFPNIPTVFRSTPYGNSIRSINSSSMVQPRAHSNFYSNSFFPSCTSLWNSLPSDVSAISTLPVFKRAIVNLF